MLIISGGIAFVKNKTYFACTFFNANFLLAFFISENQIGHRRPHGESIESDPG